MASNAVLFAVLAGVLWGFGPLGKRCGVDGATDATRAARSISTFVVYGLGTMMFPVIDFIALAPSPRDKTFGDTTWHHRIPVIVACGVCSGCGGIVASYALSLAARHGSSLISVVENGLYTVLAGSFILLVFHEHLGVWQWASAAIIIVGVVLAELTRPSAGAAGEKGGYGDEGETQPLQPASGGTAAAITSWFSPCTWSMNAGSLAIPAAILAGILWAAGPFGKRYGAGGAPEDLVRARSVCTYFIYNLSTFVPAVAAATARLVCFSSFHPLGADWWWMALRVFLCGVISGVGGILGTYAFALAEQGASTLVSLVENGVYTVLGAFFIGLAFSERPSRGQLFSGVLIIVAVLLVDIKGAPKK